MSKRRNRSSAPNLPQETLERARRQAAIERGEIHAEPEPQPAPAVEEKPKAAPAAPVNPYRTVSASQRRAVTEVKTRASTTRRERGTQRVGVKEQAAELDAETIAEMLENPTIFVSEDDLRRDYGYVLADIRSMAVLAAGLIVALVVLAQVLPK